LFVLKTVDWWVEIAGGITIGKITSSFRFSRSAGSEAKLTKWIAIMLAGRAYSTWKGLWQATGGLVNDKW
jgi:hypothetical protein